jgi:hypothetical protein
MILRGGFGGCFARVAVSNKHVGETASKTAPRWFLLG